MNSICLVLTFFHSFRFWSYWFTAYKEMFCIVETFQHFADSSCDFFYEMKSCTWWLKILERHMNVIRKRHRKHRVCFPWRKLSNFSWSEYQIQETYHLSHGQRIGAHILMWTKDQVIKRGKERRSILETNLIERSEMGHYGKYQYTSMQFLLTSAN